MATRGFVGKRRPPEGVRLPPGQYDVGRDFPVLTAEATPRLDPDLWTLTVDGLVGNERPLVHQRLAGKAQWRAGHDRRAQHVARRKLGKTARLGEDLGLCALARPRRPEQNQIHRPRAPRNFDFLSRPSYCWAIRWL